jgi:hypothetical protein
MDEIQLRAAAGPNPGRYRSYLLRLWRESPAEPWRCQVHCVGTRLEWRFAGLAEMFAFLVADAAGECGNGEGSTETPDT